MWKYGYKLLQIPEGIIGTAMVSLEIQYEFPTWHLFRKMDNIAKATLYVRKKNSEIKRVVISMVYISNGMFQLLDHIPIRSGEELFIAFEGVKRKENSCLMTRAVVSGHYTDSDMHEKDIKLIVAKSQHYVPTDVFMHRWK